MTIRNICEEAGVSNGTFYHFFKSKDDLLSNYLFMDDWIEEMENPEDISAFIVRGYLKLTDLYVELGTEFTSGFYSAKNQAFNVFTRGSGKYISDYYRPRLYAAREKGYVRQDIPIDRIVMDLQAIVIGCVFQWCVVYGTSDIKMDLERMLSTYLEYYALTPLFFKEVRHQGQQD